MAPVGPWARYTRKTGGSPGETFPRLAVYIPLPLRQNEGVKSIQVHVNKRGEYEPVEGDKFLCFVNHGRGVGMETLTVDRIRDYALRGYEIVEGTR